MKRNGVTDEDVGYNVHNKFSAVSEIKLNYLL